MANSVVDLVKHIHTGTWRESLKQKGKVTFVEKCQFPRLSDLYPHTRRH